MDLPDVFNAIVEYDSAKLEDMGWKNKGASLKLDAGTMLTLY